MTKSYTTSGPFVIKISLCKANYSEYFKIDFITLLRQSIVFN